MATASGMETSPPLMPRKPRLSVPVLWAVLVFLLSAELTWDSRWHGCSSHCSHRSGWYAHAQMLGRVQQLETEEAKLMKSSAGMAAGSGSAAAAAAAGAGTAGAAAATPMPKADVKGQQQPTRQQVLQQLQQQNTLQWQQQNLLTPDLLEERRRLLGLELVRAEAIFQRSEAERRALVKGPEVMRAMDPPTFQARVLVPTYPCAAEERMGRWDDGGKWVCAAVLPSSTGWPGGVPSGGGKGDKGKAASAAVPVVVSIGSHGDTTFEGTVYNLTGALTQTFDPFIHPDHVQRVRDQSWLKLHEIALTSDEDDATGARKKLDKEGKVKWVKINDLLKLIGATYVDVFKIDCEGCEHGFVLDLERKYTRETQPLGQVAMEVHCVKDVARCSDIMLVMERMGYRLFHSEINPYSPGYELAFVHESRVLPPSADTAAANATVASGNGDSKKESVRRR